MPKKLFLPITLIILSLSVSPLFAQCLSRTDDVKKFWRDAGAYSSDVNKNLAGYGVIFDEADTEECSADAAVALYQKVSDTLTNNNEINRWPANGGVVGYPVGPYGGWLEGANVGLIYATALNLSRHGKLTAGLHNLLIQIHYEENLDAGCGFQNGKWTNQNSCMDDYAIAAHAWAWIAAYDNLTGRNVERDSAIDKARTAIANALSPVNSICIYDAANQTDGTTVSAGRGPCSTDTTLLTRASSPAVALGLHNGDAIPYGFGLMTSISSAAAALEVAGMPFLFEGDQGVIAEALRKYAQQRTTVDGSSFTGDCFSFGYTPIDAQSGTLHVTNTLDCSEPTNHYLPTMFPLSEFYGRYVGPTDHPFRFDVWSESRFTSAVLDANGNPNFWNAGRRAVYRTLSYYWVNYRPMLTGTLNRVSLRTYNGNYLQAVNGGGSSVDAMSTSVGAYQQFGLIDINGGTLNDGDLVRMQVENGNWVAAENGGGPGSVVNANNTDPLSPETFVVHRMNGAGAIVSGDSVSLSASGTGYYMVAEGGGGSLVNCDRTGAGPWETFTLTMY
jgi:hypothetical protein